MRGQFADMADRKGKVEQERDNLKAKNRGLKSDNAHLMRDRVLLKAEVEELTKMAALRDAIVEKLAAELAEEKSARANEEKRADETHEDLLRYMAEVERLKKLMRDVVESYAEQRSEDNAPTHAHQNPPHWDDAHRGICDRCVAWMAMKKEAQR
jgi:peptidoglycan hydrolase CwlO-like protein